MNKNFRVGDKVRRINYSSKELSLGDIVTIKRIHNKKALLFYGYNKYYLIENFELVEKEEKHLPEYIQKETNIKYFFNRFTYLDLLKKKPVCKEADLEALELLKEITNEKLFSYDILISTENDIYKFPTLLKQRNLDWLVKNNFVIREDTILSPGTILEQVSSMGLKKIKKKELIFLSPNKIIYNYGWLYQGLVLEEFYPIKTLEELNKISTHHYELKEY